MPISGPFRSLPTAASPSSQLRPNVRKVFWNLYLLPVVFLALLSNVSALTMSPRPAPTCPNTAFHALEVLNPEAHRQEAESPVCCLRPLPPIPKEHGEPPDENTEPELLSFEEWKLKMSKESSAKMQNTSSAPLPSQEVHLTNETVNFSTSSNASSINASSPSHAGESTMDSALLPPSLEQPRTFHHSQVPLTDRFNYASTDCSARIHLAHKGAQSPGAILSSKKDRYMLSPCSTGDKFVVVELCDDIRIDTVQLANFEFFSGVFKDFSLSFAKTYSTSLASWTPAGTFRAKNVRNVQSFHPPSTIRDFYRFIRIDFESHYGSEYYCPVSLLRVYGLTHLEQWKWEKWEEEWAERMAAAGQPVLLTAKEENEYDPTNEHVTTAAESTTIQTTDESVIPQILDPGMQHQLSKSVDEITGLTLESSSMSNSLLPPHLYPPQPRQAYPLQHLPVTPSTKHSHCHPSVLKPVRPQLSYPL
ncbi:UNC-like C-terminal-domain-containing protein [Flagelloscypha sp. PMI_526]|nr:UNC-like C-terminal-domain-containing protein [Flagelloscypha sp. PMI_526]